ncbi:MAG: Eco57I restriction-modification methylase domain-containing protein, partial [Patescibacteria group bacterium]|nr:Eco57I restriction-modification methylase domain-containing protein [Patescibacteria group bacterium]
IKNDPKIKSDFEGKGVDTVNFAKKLLGQIVFLYFLQKKGWFGVEKGKGWDTGSKRFLRDLYDGKIIQYKNFFNDVLEPLFYDALARDRSDIDHYNEHFKTKIPFLNGGLFDPINNYDWVNTDILLSDELFSNRTKYDSEGTGILDVFDLYNFTVREDEPLEKEVAIDPELLGKAYEKFNAIRPDNYDEFRKALKSGKKGEENKFNKKFGVYYTPREIVHYMCQQSLINYLSACLAQADLATELSDSHSSSISRHSRESGNPVVSKEDIEALIHTGEQVGENESTVGVKGKETDTYFYKLPESIRKNAKLIDEKLAEIKVCDPAVGSGAFPVGMMTEIVKIRNVLTNFIRDDIRTSYQFKRACIEHSLYGVDIDPGAVEMTKLRLWLSLVVDEQNIKDINPLPNLDYKIMQGNSLISEFMGINFDIDKKQSSEKSMFKYETDKVIEQFQQKKDEFLNESNVSQKSKLKKEIDDLLVKIFETKLKTQKTNYFNRLKDIEDKYSVVRNEKQRHELIKQDKDNLNKKFDFDLESAEKQLKEFSSGRKIKPFFLWNLYFSEVFLSGAKSASGGHNKDGHVRRSGSGGGFDIVIANPPYIRIQEIQKNDSQLATRLKDSFLSASGSFDIYACFVELAIRLICDKGNISYILPHKFFQAAFGKNLRQLISSKRMLRKIVDFGSSQVFETATTYTCLLFLSHQNNSFKFAELKPDTIVTDLPEVFELINRNEKTETEKAAITIISNTRTMQVRSKV